MYRFIRGTAFRAAVLLATALMFLSGSRLRALVRRRRGLKFGIPAMLLAIPYWLLAQWLMGLVAAGATPALLCIAVPAGFSALLFVGLGPWSLVLLARARAIEAHQAWRARRTQPEPA